MKYHVVVVAVLADLLGCILASGRQLTRAGASVVIFVYPEMVESGFVLSVDIIITFSCELTDVHLVVTTLSQPGQEVWMVAAAASVRFIAFVGCFQCLVASPGC